jgi:hypothetical protein
MKEEKVIKRTCSFALLLMVLYWTIARAQNPMMEKIADKVIQKYQQSSCEQLSQKKSEPKSPQEQEVLKILRNDPQLRTAFINKVAAPIANKMFECGMIP